MNDPINVRDVKTSSSDVGAEKNAGGCIAELEKGRCTFCLFLFSLEFDMKIALKNVFGKHDIAFVLWR